MKYARTWTVIVARPDYITGDQLRDMFWLHTDGVTPEEAAQNGRLEALHCDYAWLNPDADGWNPSLWYGAPENGTEEDAAADYYVVAVIPGAHEGWREG